MVDFNDRFMITRCKCGFTEQTSKKQYRFYQYNTGRAWVIQFRERQEPHRMLKDKNSIGEWKEIGGKIWQDLKFPGTITGLAESLILLLTQFESEVVESQTDLLKQLSDLEQTVFYCTDRIVDAIKNNKGIIDEYSNN